MPLWLEAGLWGLLAGSALLIGAVAGVFANLPKRAIAGITAFGAGVLVSALSIDLIDDAFRLGGFDATAIGFIGGALLFTIANWYPHHFGGRHRKHHGLDHIKQPTENELSGSGRAIAIGAFIDGVPESIAIGVSMIAGGAVSVVTVAAIFLSNFPEALSSSWGDECRGPLLPLYLRCLGRHRREFWHRRPGGLLRVQRFLRRCQRRLPGGDRGCHPGHAGGYHDSHSLS